MSLSDLTPMTKIEVVVASDDVAEVSTLMQSLGARGYTAITGVAGVGHHGARGGRLLFNDHDALTLLVTVVVPERADAIVDGIRPLLERAAGVMFVSPTAVSRPDYFV
ncbi:MAG: nitrogen regulatory protein [Microbacterium sp.]|jgi:nitrogen regulatory protein PII|nr:nitrogen regulatory protein [Microbacterium sp.]